MPPRDEAYPQLLSLAVHEFRTPASVVAGYLRMLQHDIDPTLSDRQRKMVDEAAKSCTRLIDLVAELSEISKLDEGRATLAQQSFDLFSLLRQVAEGVHEPAERDVRLAVQGESAGAPMIGDLTRLRQAFTAIFRAILREKTSACTVVVDWRVERSGGGRSAVIVVADKESVQRSYESERSAFDENRGGLGLALPIARRIIELHGGRLWSPAGDEAGRGAALVAFPLAELSP